MAFLNDITLGQYYPGDSFLHRLDPRSKLLASLIFMTCLLLSNDLYLILIQAGLFLLAMYFSKIPYKVVLKNLKWFFWLFLITFCIHVLDLDIISTLPFLSFKISEHGLIIGLSYTIRLALFIVFASLLTLTTTPIELTDSLEKLFSSLKQLKLPVHEFALMMTLTIRFIPILIREAERIKNAQLSRGASLEGRLLQRIKNIIPMLLPLFISAIRRADDLAVAMEARHYIGGEGRTNYHQLVFKSADFGLVIFSGAFLCGIVLLQ
ncbi:MAG: energy-coupling factor transporter transmembrane component T family protein [bacterium]